MEEIKVRANYFIQNRKAGWLMMLVGIIAAVLFLSSCNTQSEPEVRRVGVLAGLSFVASITDGFKAEMAKLGYIEGENIIYDIQSTEFDIAAYQNALKKFVADDVDLILVFPTEASYEAKVATEGTDIPVVFNFALIEGMGLVDSVREPGGNMTGVRYPLSSGKLAAPLADKIFKGTPAGTIPVVWAENFVQINYAAAQDLGIEVSQGLLSQADEIIR